MAARENLSMSSASGHNNNSPNALYNLTLIAIVNGLDCKVTTLERISKLPELPLNLLIDVYELMSRREQLMDTLTEELANLDVFHRLVRYIPARSKLLRIVVDLMTNNKAVTRRLSDAYVGRIAQPSEIEAQPDIEQVEDDADGVANGDGDKEAKDKELNDVAGCSSSSSNRISISINYIDNMTKTANNAAAAATAADDGGTTEPGPLAPSLDSLSTEDAFAIDLGLRLGSFLSEAGWMQESIAVLLCLNERLKRHHKDALILRVDCLQRLLYAESSHCNFKLAQQTFVEMVQLTSELKDMNMVSNPLFAMACTQISSMYFARNEYNNSHMWSVQAMHYLDKSASPRIAIDVLRQAAKACVVKRDFCRANLLICQAVRRAHEHFGVIHQKYGDAVLDYGFFLLNVDSVFQSVKVYKEALEVRRGIFGNMNFHVAIAHEDLSYAYYVHEYSTGDFSCAQDHVDKAVNIMKNLVPSNHLMLASAKRVKALLLEEIALDKIADGMDEEDLLLQSEQLHIFALQLSLEVFGEMNVQTAKHYGNLGRLYQTMNRFEEAESMHQKAIKIKTDLLGPHDYEVGLSIGHLASLYNYQMKKFRQAEDLYLRSIDISLQLFGRTYSGLEYDYLGLCHVYETLHDFEKYLRYAHTLENWQQLRVLNATNNSSYPPIEEDYSIDQVKEEFFSMSEKRVLEPPESSKN
ncbi:amyloid protein-binding protein 2 isoform X2 [Drosophila grimshawi]|uniref:amyloid protein-binding protein 2 isoform X2 n=1 Tax=Drosophila grimshawi TaxID=7222 RepID=UPI000C87061C|nr:amyloid protein-binding protein 2 isoform X2 [Drosophila grimshawi]